MKRIYIFYIAGLISISFFSCKKFVEVDPKGQLIPKETINFRYLMNNSDNLLVTHGTNELGTDELDMNDPGLLALSGSYANIYKWNTTLFGQSDNDADWNNLYKLIYEANIVTAGVGASTGGSEAEKNQLMGEALIHRAFAYWVLVNQYSKVYDKNTASTDPGVPLVLQPVLQASLARVSVQKIYDQIFLDINTAIPFLPAMPSNNLFPSKGAAYALLARTYLFMGDYQNALTQSKLALGINKKLNDLQTYESDPLTLPLAKADQEILLSKTSDLSYYDAYRLSDDLLNLLQPDDLRYILYTVDGAAGQLYSTFTGRGMISAFRKKEPFNVGLGIPEQYLIKAECEARTGDFSTAMTTLNALRINRFRAADYQPLSAISATDALQQITSERRRELLFSGMRWFDLRRLNNEAAFAKVITRTYQGTTYTLEPNSSKYIYQIAPRLILLNPEITQNPRE